MNIELISMLVIVKVRNATQYHYNINEQSCQLQDNAEEYNKKNQSVAINNSKSIITLTKKV